MQEIYRMQTLDGFLSERMNVHSNALFGFIDRSGKYFIPQRIKMELIKLKKVKRNVYDNSVFCVANCLGVGEVAFEIKYQKESIDGIAQCELYLLENVYKINGYCCDTIRTKLAVFEASVKDFLEKSYSAFNISLTQEDDDDDVLDGMVEDGVLASYMLSKKQYEHAILREMEETVDKIYEGFFNAKMDLLKKQQSSFTSTVLREYEKELGLVRDRFLTIKGSDNFFAQNQLLDKAIEANLGISLQSFEEEEDFLDRLERETLKANKEFDKLENDADRIVRKNLPNIDSERIVNLSNDLTNRNENIEVSEVWGRGAKSHDADLATGDDDTVAFIDETLVIEEENFKEYADKNKQQIELNNSLKLLQEEEKEVEEEEEQKTEQDNDQSVENDKTKKLEELKKNRVVLEQQNQVEDIIGIVKEDRASIKDVSEQNDEKSKLKKDDKETEIGKVEKTPVSKKDIRHKTKATKAKENLISEGKKDTIKTNNIPTDNKDKVVSSTINQRYSIEEALKKAELRRQEDLRKKEEQHQKEVAALKRQLEGDQIADFSLNKDEWYFVEPKNEEAIEEPHAEEENVTGLDQHKTSTKYGANKKPDYFTIENKNGKIIFNISKNGKKTEGQLVKDDFEREH